MSSAKCRWQVRCLLLLLLPALVCPALTDSDGHQRAKGDDADENWSNDDTNESASFLLQIQSELDRTRSSLGASVLNVEGSPDRPAVTLDEESPTDSLESAIALNEEKETASEATEKSTQTSRSSFPIWLPIVVVGIPFLILLGYMSDYVLGRDSFREWMTEVTLADLPADRRCSYYFFGLALGVALATLQFIGPVRVALFFDVVGTSKEPLAKSLVLVVLLPIVMLYSIGVSLLPSTRALVIAVNGFYTLVFLFLTCMIAFAEPKKWVVWLLYFAVETKGVILMPMIWSVVADVSTTELSKKAYPFIFFVTQLGGIGGSYIAISVDQLGGEVGLLAIQTGVLALIGALTWAGVAVIKDRHEYAEVTFTETKDSAGTESLSNVALKRIWEGGEGLWLLVTRPYVFGAYFVSYATLVTRTILDYENGVLVKDANPEVNDQVSYFGHMTLIQNILIATITLLGTRRILEIFSVGKVLLVLPLVSLSMVLMLCGHFHLMTSTIACITVSTVAYALNSPCKEILFVRTSRDIKYKAKSWSEMYGNNIMKILGAQVNLFENNESPFCKPHCFHKQPTALMSTMWVTLWLFVAAAVGARFQQLEAEDKIVT